MISANHAGMWLRTSALNQLNELAADRHGLGAALNNAQDQEGLIGHFERHDHRIVGHSGSRFSGQDSCRNDYLGAIVEPLPQGSTRIPCCGALEFGVRV